MKNNLLFLFIVCTYYSFGLEHSDIIVAKDGTGQFTSIQSALNSIPKNNSTKIVILIKNGTYHEKLFITASFISFVGENQDSTRIVYAELRKKLAEEQSE